mmetsp:Transcript_19074/g.23640  ORF Transcript_19074/g.23640 Transcript_19074/m.23640 type:complete len:466 (-) Transcript_19074:358-1755(-)
MHRHHLLFLVGILVPTNCESIDNEQGLRLSQPEVGHASRKESNGNDIADVKHFETFDITPVYYLTDKLTYRNLGKTKMHRKRTITKKSIKMTTMMDTQMSTKMSAKTSIKMSVKTSSKMSVKMTTKMSVKTSMKMSVKMSMKMKMKMKMRMKMRMKLCKSKKLSVDNGTGGGTYKPSKTVYTDKNRENDLMDIFKEVSGDEPFNDPQSPQSLAAEWILRRDKLFVCPNSEKKKVIQRYVMAVYYWSHKGQDWSMCFEGDEGCGKQDNDFKGKMAYLSPGDECEWAGNTCKEKFIDSIIFEEEINVKGTIPMEIGEIDMLEVISMEAQVIGGTLPPEMAKPQNLRIIDYDFNRLTGTIPEEYYSLPLLEQLDFNNNFLSGTLSPSIGNLQSLIFIQLHYNQFTGTFPQELLDAPILVAEFQFNNFFGPMPLCIGAPDQTIGAISVDCGPASGAPVTCGEGCGCECF